MRIADESFFTAPVLELAEKLLGKVIVRRLANGEVRHFRITEVEAYGANDTACHAYRGKTKRNAPMFEKGGILYVYLCYGIFDLLNIVSGNKDEPEAVLIRGVNGVEGPGRASRMMEITRELNREDLMTSNEIWVEDDGCIATNIEHLKRVGIGYASKEDQDKLWRFKMI
ncbi:MAG: DNA-3-methyladenine glycosylase [Firmicutes bacterium]|nr:DNA-3-methyladenine glycosylase [Bacillota bacterium]